MPTSTKLSQPPIPDTVSKKPRPLNYVEHLPAHGNVVGLLYTHQLLVYEQHVVHVVYRNARNEYTPGLSRASRIAVVDVARSSRAKIEANLHNTFREPLRNMAESPTEKERKNTNEWGWPLIRCRHLCCVCGVAREQAKPPMKATPHRK